MTVGVTRRSDRELEEIGFKVVIFPNALTRAFAHAGQALLAELSTTGTTTGFRDRMFDHDALWSLFDYQTWLDLERDFGIVGKREVLQDRPMELREIVGRVVGRGTASPVVLGDGSSSTEPLGEQLPQISVILGPVLAGPIGSFLMSSSNALTQ